MARELITSWGDYQAAIDRLLAMATESIFIYDQDLGQLKLDSATRLDQLRRILSAGQRDALQIALRNADPLRRQHPALLGLLSTYCHIAAAHQTPEQLAHLRDCMILVDNKHGLIRFEQEQPRSKLLIDETDELKPYLTRFAELLAEGGEQVSSTTLGL